MKGPFSFLFVLVLACLFATGVFGGVRDICGLKPEIVGLCVSSTFGIYYDAETQRCRYMGCSPDKKIFTSLEDCEKICNGNRHRRMRQKYPKQPHL